MKYKPEAIIRTDIKIFNEAEVSKNKYFDKQHVLTIDRKIENKKIMDFLIGKKQFNRHLDILEGKVK